ncbi:MAG: extracellular solute-binding protein [Candidatus Andersenbacteria bacterium]
MSYSLRFRLRLALLLVLSAVLLTGFGCRRTTDTNEQLQGALEVWGLWQESSHMAPVVEAFEQQFGVEVEYRKIGSVANYERLLLEALAQGRGPDVFVVHHTWVESKRGLLNPAPAEVIDTRAVQEEFVDVVARDVVRDDRVYALPTSVDTLALYYNKDILNAAGIPRPPATWTDMQRVVERVTRVSRIGSIQQSAIALGTAQNINRAADILQLLMLQSGLPILTEQGTVSIANDIGDRALVFYTDFANKAKKVYTWDLSQDFSIDAFAEGDTAMMLNYSYHVATVRAKNPRLNFAIAPLPQIADSSEQNKVNFAAYWPYGVSASSPAPQTAWQFVRFMTGREPSLLINHAQQVPPARRDSVEEFQRDPTLGVFADQVLTAATWARPDIVATDVIFNTMIDSIVKGEATTPSEALRRAQDQLNQLRENDDQSP